MVHLEKLNENGREIKAANSLGPACLAFVDLVIYLGLAEWNKMSRDGDIRL